MKEYFPHDYNARNDKKLSKVMWKHGVCGIGCFWCIVEMLYEEDGYLSVDDYERIAFELHTDIELVRSVVNDFDLFVVKDGIFFSESAIGRLNIRADKSEKARQSAIHRWKKTENDASALPPDSECNAKKTKESKVNKIKKEIILDFVSPEFSESFEKWLKYKKEKKQSYVSYESTKSAYNKLLKLSGNNPEIAAEIVDQSLANNYAGLFELKNQTNGKTINGNKGKLAGNYQAAEELAAEIAEKSRSFAQKNK